VPEARSRIHSSSARDWRAWTKSYASIAVLEVSGSNLYVIQARPGYLATPPGTSGQVDPVDRERELDREVSGVSTLADFAATVAFRLGSAQTAGAAAEHGGGAARWAETSWPRKRGRWTSQ